MTAPALDAADELLTYPDAAALAGVAPSTLRRWVSEGRLRSYRDGRVAVVLERDLLELEYTLRTAPPARRGRPRHQR